jgi:hypothetical protein
MTRIMPSSSVISRGTSDIVAYFIIVMPVLVALIFESKLVWATFIAGFVGLIVSLFNSFTKKGGDNDKGVKWESGFAHWFIVVKTLTSAVGVLLMNVFREQGYYTPTTHGIVATLLVLNIFEAVVRDVQLGYLFNAFSGVCLITSIPYTLSSEHMALLADITTSTRTFVFPLSFQWVLLYSSWNACFAYDDNYSWMTRLILVPPVLIALLIRNDLWLSARVLLLMIHLILRAIQPIWFYQPGNSFLTPTAGSIQNPKDICVMWGRVNCLLSLVYIAAYHKELALNASWLMP